MRIFDLFPFFNEIPLLELRILELRPVVSAFGLVELPRTFTDLPKPLYFHEKRADFEHFGKEIRTFMPEAIPSGPHPTVDWFQRAQLSRLIPDAEPDDIVMLSDVDEIPSREAVRDIVSQMPDHPVALKQRLYYHRVDLYDPGMWIGTVIAKRKCLGADPNLQELRENRGNFPIYADGGWHFSWLGDGHAIAKKLDAVDIERENQIYGAHGIKEPPNDPDFFQSCYQHGMDLFSRGRTKQQVAIVPGVNQPQDIEQWLRKYPQYARQEVSA